MPEHALRAKHVSGFTITCDLRDPVQRVLFYTGTYERTASALISSALREGDTFLDVGANVGHFTFLAAAIVGSSGCVHSIEPSPSTAAALRGDVDRNRIGHVVRVHEFAAGDRFTSMPLRHESAPEGAAIRSLDPRGPEDGAVSVAVAPLDRLLAGVRPAVVKVDAEGADLRALVGMRQILVESRPRLVLTEAEDAHLARFGDSAAGMVRFMEALCYEARPFSEPWNPAGIAFVPRTSSPGSGAEQADDPAILAES